MEVTMKVEFEKVIDGLNRYIDREIYKNLNDLQEMLARLTIGRINQNADGIKRYLMTNGFFKTLCLVDSDGMVDIDSLLQDLRTEIERKGSITVEVPLIGKITFKANDVDILRNEIAGGY
jgi:hypothetical protein